MPGQDQDNDGDYDFFDQQHETLDQNPFLEGLSNMDGGTPTEQQLYWDNTVHEFFEDVFELFDGNPDNNSFEDGGNGSGNETPADPSGGTHQSAFPSGIQYPGLPVLLSGIDNTNLGMDDGMFGI